MEMEMIDTMIPGKRPRRPPATHQTVKGVSTSNNHLGSDDKDETGNDAIISDGEAFCAVSFGEAQGNANYHTSKNLTRRHVFKLSILFACILLLFGVKTRPYFDRGNHDEVAVLETRPEILEEVKEPAVPGPYEMTATRSHPKSTSHIRKPPKRALYRPNIRRAMMSRRRMVSRARSRVRGLDSFDEKTAETSLDTSSLDEAQGRFFGGKKGISKKGGLLFATGVATGSVIAGAAVGIAIPLVGPKQSPSPSVSPTKRILPAKMVFQRGLTTSFLIPGTAQRMPTEEEQMGLLSQITDFYTAELSTAFSEQKGRKFMYSREGTYVTFQASMPMETTASLEKQNTRIMLKFNSKTTVESNAGSAPTEEMLDIALLKSDKQKFMREYIPRVTPTDSVFRATMSVEIQSSGEFATNVPTAVLPSLSTAVPSSYVPSVVPTLVVDFGKNTSAAPSANATSMAPSQALDSNNNTFTQPSGTNASSTSPSSSQASNPSLVPSTSPASIPSGNPSSSPSLIPTLSHVPSLSQSPSMQPTLSAHPSLSNQPSDTPSSEPSRAPSSDPSVSPSQQPSQLPSITPSDIPTISPSSRPSLSFYPSLMPSQSPSPSLLPSADPSSALSDLPSDTPNRLPSSQPSFSGKPSTEPSISFEPSHSTQPTMKPSASSQPSASTEPSIKNSPFPTKTSSSQPSASIQPSQFTEPTASSRPSASTEPSINNGPYPNGRRPYNTESLSIQPSASIEPSQSKEPTGQPTLSGMPSLSSKPSVSAEPSTSPTAEQAYFEELVNSFTSIFEKDGTFNFEKAVDLFSDIFKFHMFYFDEYDEEGNDE